MALSNQQQQFVFEYVQCWNASEAARRAGYSDRTAGQQGYRLLKDERVKTFIKEVLRANLMSAEEVLARLADQARFDLGTYIRVIDGAPDEDSNENSSPTEADGSPSKSVYSVYIDLDALKRDGKAHLIKRVWQDKDGYVRVEFYDVQRALELTGKYHGLFVDRTFNTPVGDDFDLEEWRANRQQRLDAVRSLPSKPDESEIE